MGAKILFLIPYPVGESPSQRFRFEQYFTVLREHGHDLVCKPFLDSIHWKVFFKPGNNLLKLRLLITFYCKRIGLLRQVARFDFVFIHREASPMGPPVFEWIIAKLMKKKVIYDFDDAIWLTDRMDEPYWMRFLKWRSKVATVCKLAYRVSCGNEYLVRYAKKFNDNVRYNPTTVDTNLLHNPGTFSNPETQGKIILGWTGSHSTLKYLNEIERILQKLEQRYPEITIVVIADKKPELNLRRLEFVQWRKETEVEDLLRFDIGLMPLPDDAWTRGKCGFKILQYMALRIPAVASPVGVNVELIKHGETGFLCSTENEWLEALSYLIEKQEQRFLFGKKGRAFVEQHYSVSSNSANFLNLFE